MDNNVKKKNKQINSNVFVISLPRSNLISPANQLIRTAM